MLRLETMRELSDIIIDLKPALKLLQNVSKELFEFLPDVSNELGNVNEAIMETLHAAKITTDESIIAVNKKTAGGEEILKEVSNFIEQKLSEKLPEPPASSIAREAQPVKELVALSATSSQLMGNESIKENTDSSQAVFSYKKAEIQEFSLKVEEQPVEDMLLDYLKKSNGAIDITKCSNDLKFSSGEIEKALENLGTKGKIKIELKTTK